MGLLSSTRIQSVVVPLLTTPQNILMKSQTGSGKTLAYLIPLLNDLMRLVPAVKRGDGTRALIIAPTRELCSQIADVLARLTQCCVWIVGGSITGGEKKKSEKARLRKGVTVLVGTPGTEIDKTTAEQHESLLYQQLCCHIKRSSKFVSSLISLLRSALGPFEEH
jgi:ATP-dependent RNA helicase DDX31/DBP7